MIDAHLTEDEEAAILGAEAQGELLERLRDGYGLDGWWIRDDGQRHTPVDVAELLAGDYEAPDMLVRGWLVRGVLHLLYSDAEAGKTWIALGLALEVMRSAQRVLWVDEELGPRDLTERLRALGATPEEVRDRFVYLAFPDWTLHDNDVRSWRSLVRTLATDSRGLGLVVIDTVTDSLANAAIDENSGVEVTGWIKTYPEAATMHGVTTLLLDHVGKGEGGAPKHAVGSRAKRAKAKVQYALHLPKPARDYYNATKLGRVRVTLTKNTLGAEIERERELSMGGDGAGNFVIRPHSLAEALTNSTDDLEHEGLPLESRILDSLREAGEPLSANAVDGRIRGRKSEILKALKRLADGPAPVRAMSGPNRSTLYEYIVDDAAGAANVNPPAGGQSE